MKLSTLILNPNRGMTLIELLVTIGLIGFSFIGIYGIFILSIDVVTGAKARAGALALANERLEQIRSLPYALVGTVNGIPSGSFPQIETVVLNQTTYTRRTFIEYIDDSSDGSGVADSNGIAADYKKVKVEMLWTTRDSLRNYSIVTNIVPPGIESTAGGGTLRIQIINASAGPVSDATVRIVNTTGTSTVDVTTYSDPTGIVLFPGSPVGSGYQITVTKGGYSSSQTYSSSAQNPNPNPGHLSISQAQTTTGTFAIDTLASLGIATYTGVESKIWNDLFADASQLQAMSSTTVSGGALSLASGETIGSATSATTSPSYLYSWNTADFTPTIPLGSSLLVRVYFDSGSGPTLVPDSSIAGNSAGFSSSPISLAGVSTSTYPNLSLGASFDKGSAGTSPSLDAWSISYDQGPIPLPNLAFTLRGTKTIGTDAGGSSIYKFSQALVSGASALFSTTTLEWDSYTTTVDSTATGFDIAGVCAPLPISVAPSSSTSASLYVLPHTTNSLLVTIKDASTGNSIAGATVVLTRSGFSSTKKSIMCGQTFFSGLSAGTVSGGNTYSLEISKTGYQTANQSGVVVSGSSVASISLTPL